MTHDDDMPTDRMARLRRLQSLELHSAVDAETPIEIIRIDHERYTELKYGEITLCVFWFKGLGLRPFACFDDQATFHSAAHLHAAGLILQRAAHLMSKGGA